MPFLSLNLPTILTLIRLLASIIILPFLIVYLLPQNIFWLNSLITILFLLIALTDFFDGYLARKYKLETSFGRELDHIADKFLVTSTLISLLAINKIYFFWALLLILRELFLLALRLIATESNKAISVLFIGKLKTTFQFIMLGLIILNPAQNLGLTESYWNIIESITIFFALLFSLLSAFIYFNIFLKRFKFM
ncbi:MAG: CDP-diacylglycerol--glycerol-3-phosphate 3-phosphatidyltransferase [Candidatus Babeliales bacterium]|nr:CDP-diacylglycerol--glycerol-3-phosphate 3-phosphatidyltransferase [Candidatus Babeliales bacterium]